MAGTKDTTTSIIPEAFRDLLDRPIVVAVATLMPDGQPQVQPVWCSYDGTHVCINTARGRQKYHNLTRRPQVTVLAVDPDDDNRWLEVRGVVVEETEAGAAEHIDRLAQLYLGLDRYPWHAPGDVRVMFRIAPLRVATLGTTMPGLSVDKP
jgi:PPOX class probable F420-dependent enzyme